MIIRVYGELVKEIGSVDNWNILFTVDTYTSIRMCVGCYVGQAVCTAAAQVTEPHSRSVHGPQGGPCAPD